MGGKVGGKVEEQVEEQVKEQVEEQVERQLLRTAQVAVRRGRSVQCSGGTRLWRGARW